MSWIDSYRQEHQKKPLRLVRASATEWSGVCPYCRATSGDPKRHTLFVNPYKVLVKDGKRMEGVWHCVRHGGGGSLQSLAREYDVGQFGPRRKVIPMATPGLPDEYLPFLPEHEAWATTPHDAPHWAALRYLYLRKITHEQILKHQIGWCPTGKYEGRVIVPIFWEGKAITFIGRDYTGLARSKVLTPPSNGMLKDFFFNLDKVDKSKPIVLVEGWGGALFVGDDAIASCGKDVCRPQRQRLVSAVRDVVILFDQGAERSAWCTAEMLIREGLKGEVRVALCPTRQPDDGTKEGIREAITNAVPFSRPKYLEALLRYPKRK